MRKKSINLIALFSLAVLVASPGIAKSAEIIALTTSNELLRLDSATPDTITQAVTITGLMPEEFLKGIDFRPATGELYGLGDSRIYVIDVSTGAASQVGVDGAWTLDGNSFGVDFNPVPDRLRLVSDNQQNLRINPMDGTLAMTDAKLNPGDPTIVAAAYDRNFAGTSATTLFVIDSGTDMLLRQGSIDGSPDSPNNGVLTAVGALNQDTSELAGLDIAADGRAFASLTVAGISGLYSIKLAGAGAGAATLLGNIGENEMVQGLSVAPASLEFSVANYQANEAAGSVDITVVRNNDATGTVAVDYATSDGTATEGSDYTGASGTLTFDDGETSQIFTISLLDDSSVENTETVNFTLSNPDMAILGIQTTAVLNLMDDDDAAMNGGDMGNGNDGGDGGNDGGIVDAGAMADGGGCSLRPGSAGYESGVFIFGLLSAYLAFLMMRKKI